jgi:hypothetical protein
VPRDPVLIRDLEGEVRKFLTESDHRYRQLVTRYGAAEAA